MKQDRAIMGKMKLPEEQLASLQAYESCDSQELTDPRVEVLVTGASCKIPDLSTFN